MADEAVNSTPSAPAMRGGDEPREWVRCTEPDDAGRVRWIEDDAAAPSPASDVRGAADARDPGPDVDAGA